MFRNQLVRLILLLLLAAFLAACTRPAPEPDRCYTLVLDCGSGRVEYRVSRHWTELRPPNLYIVCWVRCGTGTRGCTSLDGCTFYHRW